MAWVAYGIYLFLENGGRRLWNLRISREWRGLPMEFTYFSRMAWVAYGIYVFLEVAYGIRTLGSLRGWVA